MQLLLLIAGVVGLVIEEQFSGQDTIAWFLIGLFVGITLIQLAFFAFAAKSVTSRRF